MLSKLITFVIKIDNKLGYNISLPPPYLGVLLSLCDNVNGYFCYHFVIMIYNVDITV